MHTILSAVTRVSNITNRQFRLKRNQVAAGATIFSLVLQLMPIAAFALAPPNPGPPVKIEICHATDAETNPYNSADADKTADAGGHATNHTGPVWYPGAKADNVIWGDIIPPFDYTGGSFPGMNWTAEGQAILNNGCAIPSSTIIVEKQTSPDGDPTIFEFSTNYSGNFYLSDGQTNTNSSLAKGIYSVDEVYPLPADWTLSNASCNDGSPISAIDLGIGETVTCTFINAYTPVPGCTDPTATNYDPSATVDDGSCVYPPVSGCTDSTASNYDPAATIDDGSCIYPPVLGCTDLAATNYDPSATDDDGSCRY